MIRLPMIAGCAALCLAFLTATSAEAGDGYRLEVPDSGRAFAGTTLFADNSDPRHPRLVEVDMAGQVVWSYPVPDSLYPPSRTPRNSLADVERLKNGNTLFVIQQVGIFEVDKAGALVWSHRDSGASHDADRLENGNTLYVRGWEAKGGKHLVEVDAQGQEVWSWDALAAYDREPFNEVSDQGWIHVNAVTRLADGTTTVVGLRNFNLVVEIAPDGTVMRETPFPPKPMDDDKRIKMRAHPHDPEYQAEGTLLAALTGKNRIIEVPVGGGQPVWHWQHPAGGWHVVHIRDANRLPNGNLLVVEGNALNEVTRTGKVIWRLKVPAIDISAQGKATFLFKAQRIAPDGTAYGG